ncbi:MAG: tyrosine/phenylalanine carboxypeptidase domain-containing protein [Candidatus Absconditicoccaceae bacterium]
MNARNLLYIKKFNDKKSIRLANNKLQTKNFLAERGIPLAQTYGVIKDRKNLFDFDFGNLPKKNFVIKPNKGSKGQGILIARFLGESEEAKHDEKIIKKGPWKKFKDFLQGRDDKHNFQYNYQIGNDIVNDMQLRRYLIDILDGKYSMTLGTDKIIVEEKLVAGEGFKEFCEYGLADIRIIVFNLVPVAAMIRVPTSKSKGKANLAAGGIGFGINIGTGRISSMLYKKRIRRNKFPTKYKDFWDKKIPYRDDILFLSSKIQYFVNLGYLALDRVITNDGPKLLEINARAGLEVQNISGIRLEKTLDKIADLKIEDPEKGVEIAKTLFSKDIGTNSKILFLSQYGSFKIKLEEDHEIKYDVIVEVNLNKKGNYASPTLCEEIKSHPKSKILLGLPDNDIIIKDIKVLPEEDLNEKKIILGSKTISNYLIKPIHKTFDTVNIVSEKHLVQKEKEQLQNIDQKIDKLNRKILLTPILRPKNYFNELDNFIVMKGKYNPKFIYNRPDDKKLENIEIEIDKLERILENNEVKSGLKFLFSEKLNELSNRVKLLRAYKKQDYENILNYNEQLFGKIDPELVKLSKKEFLDDKDLSNFDLLGRKMSMAEVQDFIERYLIEKKIYGVDISFNSGSNARVSVLMGKNIKINVSKAGVFREKELLSILAHEIDTHLMRHINGMRSGRSIFKSGTGYYMKDEEGLAIYNSFKHLPEGYNKLTMYKEYFLINEASKYGFHKLFDIAKFLYPRKENLEKLFKAIVRIKRGIENTAIVDPGTVFYKDKVYLEGYLKIKDRIEKGGDESKLYKGKVKIEDLDFIV